MRRPTLAMVAAGLACAAYSSAHAQTYAYEEERFEGPAVVVEPAPAPRVYGYYTDNDDGDAGAAVIELQRRPGVPGGCGEYFYWNGVQCVDARNKP